VLLITIRTSRVAVRPRISLALAVSAHPAVAYHPISPLAARSLRHAEFVTRLRRVVISAGAQVLFASALGLREAVTRNSLPESSGLSRRSGSALDFGAACRALRHRDLLHRLPSAKCRCNEFLARSVSGYPPRNGPPLGQRAGHVDLQKEVTPPRR